MIEGEKWFALAALPQAASDTEQAQQELAAAGPLSS